MKNYNVLITGAGSVMGQSIFRALSFSPLAQSMRVIWTNSNPKGAGFYFGQTTTHPKIINSLQIPLATSDEFIPCIENIIKKYNIDIVYSGTQHELHLLSSLKKISVACPPTNIIDICLDKKKTAEVLSKYNIYTPRTEYLDNIEILKDILNKLGGVVIKPNHSSASRNIFICHSESSIEIALEKIGLSKSKAYVAQEFLEGEEYTCGAYIDKHSHKIKTISIKRDLSLDGASIFGEVIKDEIIETYIHDVILALKQEGLNFGHVNIQLRKNKNTNRCGLFEINGRLSSTEAPKAYYGFNSTLAYFENMILDRESSLFNSKIKYGKFLRYYNEVYFN